MKDHRLSFRPLFTFEEGIPVISWTPLWGPGRVTCGNQTVSTSRPSTPQRTPLEQWVPREDWKEGSGDPTQKWSPPSEPVGTNGTRKELHKPLH